MIALNRKNTPMLDPELNDLSNEDIDKVLRGEYSAVQSYKQVIDKIEEEPELQELEKFKIHHDLAVEFWKSEARVEGKIPEATSGVWGKAVEAFVGTSKILGNTTALAALKNGEKHGLETYTEMLDSVNLTVAQKGKIRDTFIPKQLEHIKIITAMEKKVS